MELMEPGERRRHADDRTKASVELAIGGGSPLARPEGGSVMSRS
jgi:hypothetical protein